MSAFQHSVSVIQCEVRWSRHSLLKRKFREVDFFGSSEEIRTLPDFGLPSRLQEELDQINIARVFLEISLEKTINGGRDHERVVDCDHSNAIAEVPARLPTTSNRRVHDIVRDKKISLELEFR